MSLFRRGKKQAPTCDHGPQPNALAEAHARLTQQTAKAEQERADAVQRMSDAYYAWSAIVADDHAKGRFGCNDHMIGRMTGISEAIAVMTGIDQIQVGYRLSNGIPVLADGWIVVNRAPVGAPGDLWVQHDGVEEKWEARMDAIHRAALKKFGHPMSAVIYGDDPVSA